MREYFVLVGLRTKVFTLNAGVSRYRSNGLLVPQQRLGVRAACERGSFSHPKIALLGARRGSPA